MTTTDPLSMQPKEFDILVRLVEVHLNKIRGEKDINDLANTESTKQNTDIMYFEKLIEKVRFLKSDYGKPDKIEDLLADELILRNESKVIKRIRINTLPLL